MAKKKVEQEFLFGEKYVVGGVVHQLDATQVRQLESVGHRVLELGEIPVDKEFIVAASATGGEVVLVTRKA